MYTLRILHVSDLHARGPREGERWRRRRVLGAPWAANLDALLADGPIDLVCFTGDLANWGLAEEYAEVTDFVDDLLGRLGVARDRLFPVPGNHDINRRIGAASWKALRRAASRVDVLDISRWIAGGSPPLGLNARAREEVLDRQTAYRQWVAETLGRSDLLPERSPHGRLGYRATLRLEGRPFDIHLVGLDSGWLAGDDSDAGNLRLTDDQVMRLVTTADGTALTGYRLAMLHHPLTDLADGASCRRLLAEHVDLVLRGHLHEASPELWLAPDRALRQLAAGCLYEGSRADQYPNSCQVLEVKLDAAGRPLQYDLHLRSWSKQGHWFDDNGLYQGTRDGHLRWAAAEAPPPADAASASQLTEAQAADPSAALRVAEYFGLARTQSELDFVNVKVNGDDRLFIDPHAIRTLPGSWASTCVALLKDFFETVLRAIRERRDQEAQRLLGGLHEPNETRLGLSRRSARGRALGTQLARDVWESLSRSEAAQSGLLADLEDTVLMVEGIAEDLVSDITTNIIREPLIRYTQEVCADEGIPLTSDVDSGPIWNPQEHAWTSRYERLPRVDARKLLLVPKIIVRRKLYYNQTEYFTDYILARLREVELAANTALVHLLRDGTPRVTNKALKAKYGTGKRTAARVTRDYPEVLARYRRDKRERPDPPLRHEDFVDLEGGAPPDWSTLLRTVRRAPASGFASAMSDLLTALLYPSLTHPVHVAIDGDARDAPLLLDFLNQAVEGLFFRLAQQHPAAVVAVASVPGGADAALGAVATLRARFSPSRGRVALLVCPGVADPSPILAACQTMYRDAGELVLLVDGERLSAWVAARAADEDDDFGVLRARLHDVAS